MKTAFSPKHTYAFMIIILTMAILRPVESQADSTTMSFYVESMTINKDLAEAEGIHDTPHSIGLDYRKVWLKHLAFSTGFTLIIIDDNDEFTQSVQNINSGATSTATSNIDAGSLHADLGIQYPFGRRDKVIIGASYGFRFFNVERIISNCRNCISEHIYIENDTYLKSYVGLKVGRKSRLTLSYWSFTTPEEGFEDSVSIGWHFNL